jgi:ferric-dicitrate binding protein FerR (iron transport regulator)
VNCTTFEGIVHALADPALRPHDAEPAYAHAAACPACAAKLEAARKFTSLLDGEGREAIDAWSGQVAAAVAATETGESAAPSAPLRRLPGLGRFAAVAAASILITSVAISLVSGPEVLAEGKVTTLARGERAVVSDGRELEAEETAHVVVPEGSDGRTVRIDDGCVHFRVDPGLEFNVETPRGTANVLGTSFVVRVADDGEVAVTVHSGRVRFASRGGNDRFVLATGDRLEVDAQGVHHLVNGRRVKQLEDELLKSMMADAARHTAERAGKDVPAADATEARPATAPPTADAMRAFFESDEGRSVLAAALKTEQVRRDKEFGAKMVDGMLARLHKEADLTDDQRRKLREVIGRAGYDSYVAWSSLEELPADTAAVEKDRLRSETAAKSAEIAKRADDDVRAILSQTQYETYRRLFPAGAFGIAPDKNR